MIATHFERKAFKVIYDKVKGLYKKVYYLLGIQIILTYNLWV